MYWEAAQLREFFSIADASGKVRCDAGRLYTGMHVNDSARTECLLRDTVYLGL